MIHGIEDNIIGMREIATIMTSDINIKVFKWMRFLLSDNISYVIINNTYIIIAI